MPLDRESTLPALDAVVAVPVGLTVLTGEGELITVPAGEVAGFLADRPVLLFHARSIGRRFEVKRLQALDLLELFAFVHPGRFVLPTPAGLAQFLGLQAPGSDEDCVAMMPSMVEALLADLAASEQKSDAGGLAWRMGQAGWGWAPLILNRLNLSNGVKPGQANKALRVWTSLPEWQSQAPPPPPKPVSIEEADSRSRLAMLLGARSEDRPQQSDYAGAVTAAFAPRELPDTPVAVLAEAGTGVGKTLGYLSPATVWAERAGAPVCISTYTRNLQHQIDGELDRLYPAAQDKQKKVVIRKGRENYLCLLNFEEAASGMAARPGDVIALGLMARWVSATRDGDMTGGDFPGWLSDLLGRSRTLGLADRRGECLYSACTHYGRCFIERGVRQARTADIVIANHALVMIQAALGVGEEGTLPQRYVFDEGHHLFDAADSAFAGHLAGQDTADLRRWLVGSPTQRASRARGLGPRIEGLLDDQPEAQKLLDEVQRAARALPEENWLARLRDDQPRGLAETYLSLVRRQVYARAKGIDGPYGLETETAEPIEGLLDAASALNTALSRLQEPMTGLARLLADRLEDEAESLDTSNRQRLDALARGLSRRSVLVIGAWRSMLADLTGAPADDQVDWFGVERIEGREFGVGHYRHHIDPTAPFAEAIAPIAHGIAITSATLTDGSGEPEYDWQRAERHTGTAHFARPALRAQVPSPFDYGQQTRVFIVNDVRKDDMAQVASAYRVLFEASGGGGLGLFTAVSRLRAVHPKIAKPMADQGVAVHAQHVDGMDVATLVEIFRGERNSCLLGTDAIRDGVDVPGSSLRLIVFDRVPWPRPSILHRARREHFGKRDYDDGLTRLRLRQAFGRLIRSTSDRGVFVLLDPMMPSRLLGAFGEGAIIERTGLADAVAKTAAFLEGYGAKEGP
ncbi:MAG: ATP-dependent DNA helicase [Pseudomonadota bacterium]